MADGRVAKPPQGWQLLPPGDGTLTRRVKNAGPTWAVKQQRGRREFSKGVWAPASVILEVREALEEKIRQGTPWAAVIQKMDYHRNTKNGFPLTWDRKTVPP